MYLAKIESLFENKVGDEYNAETLKSLFKEGKERFENKIPPGFKDSGKKDDGEQEIKKYGDFIVWKQTMEKSKDSKQAVILVTDDRKEDWWVRFKGKTVSPRPELIKEFKDFTSQSFHMYQSDRFLEFAREYLDETINERTIEEIRELRRLDERRRLLETKKAREILRFKKFREGLIQERIMLDDELNYLEVTRHRIIEQLENQESLLRNSDPSAFDDRMMNELHRKLVRTERNIEALLQKKTELKEREINYRNKTFHNVV